MNTIRLSAIPALLTSLCLACLLGGCGGLLAAIDAPAIEEDPGKRTYGSQLEDQAIETKARVNIEASDPRFESAHFDVTSFNGYVLLTGQVLEEDMKSKAEEVLSRIREVRRIYNELTVSGNTSAITRVSDTVLTGKVKTALLANPETEGTRVKVKTENGVVYLMGLASRGEAERITEVARSIRGAQKIVRMFELIE